MTVKELIEILKRYKEDDIVTIESSGGEDGNGEWSWASLCVNEEEIMDCNSDY